MTSARTPVTNPTKAPRFFHEGVLGDVDVVVVMFPLSFFLTFSCF